MATDAEDRPRALLLRASEITTCEVSWLWEGYIPLGKLTLVVGDPGVGKSFMSLDLAARVSTGGAWPDGSSPGRQPGSVILIAAEDGPADTIKPRLSAAGADMERIIFFEPLDVAGNRQGFDLNRHVPQLEWAVGQGIDTRMIVIDPLTAFGGGVNERSQGAVREMLQPLVEMAARLGVAVLLISHPNKNEGGKAVYRTTGSLAYNAVARTVWYVMKDPADNERRLLLPVKNNLASDTLGRAFRILERRLEWEPDPVLITPDEALAAETRARQQPSCLQGAVSFLKQELATGAKFVNEIHKRGAQEGHSERTLDRAKKEAQIGSVRLKTKQGMKSFWHLPGRKPTSLDQCVYEEDEPESDEWSPDEDDNDGSQVYPGSYGNQARTNGYGYSASAYGSGGQAGAYGSGYGEPDVGPMQVEKDSPADQKIPF